MTDNQHTETQRDYWLKQFKETEGFSPMNDWQLMQYSLIITQQSKEHASFWKGVFGI